MTPMPNAPSPNAIFGEALARTPAPLPLSTVEQQMAQTRGLNAQVPIQQQTAQELALKNQLTQRTIKNLQIMHDEAPGLLQANNGDWSKIRDGLISKGMDADEVEKVVGAHYVTDERMANTTSLIANAKKVNQEILEHNSGIAAKLGTGMLQAVKPDGTLDPVIVQAQLLNAKAQNPDIDIDKYLAMSSKDPQGFMALMEAHRQARPDIATAQEQAQQAHYKTQEAGAAAQKAQFEQQIRQSIAQQLGLPNIPGAPVAAAAKLNTGVAGTRIPFIADAVSREINEKTNPEDYQEAYGAEVNQFINSGGDISKLGSETHKIAERGAALREAKDKALFEHTNPDILKAESEKEIKTRVGVLRAEAGTGTFSSILDSGARRAAQNDTEKYDVEFADKVGAARQLQDFIDQAARNGNKAAPGMIGIAELRQLVSRVNRTELQAVGANAGSAWDRIQGFAGKWGEGQPIPPDILRDTKILSGVMENAAKRTYDLKRQAVGKNYGIAPPPPINVPAPEAAAAAPATTVPPAVRTLLSPKTVAAGIHTLSDGTKWLKAADGTITAQ